MPSSIHEFTERNGFYVSLGLIPQQLEFWFCWIRSKAFWFSGIAQKEMGHDVISDDPVPHIWSTVCSSSWRKNGSKLSFHNGMDAFHLQMLSCCTSVSFSLTFNLLFLIIFWTITCFSTIKDKCICPNMKKHLAVNISCSDYPTTKCSEKNPLDMCTLRPFHCEGRIWKL